MAICLLRALQGKLLTRVFLTSLGIADNNICVLCNSADETIEHLFFECPFSAYLWSLCRLKLKISEPIGTLQDEALLIQTRFKSKRKITILTKLSLSAVVWHIWKERNLRVFQLQSQHKIIVFCRLYEDIRLLMRTCHWKTGRHKQHLKVLSNWNIQFSWSRLCSLILLIAAVIVNGVLRVQYYLSRLWVNHGTLRRALW